MKMLQFYRPNYLGFYITFTTTVWSLSALLGRNKRHNRRKFLKKEDKCHHLRDSFRNVCSFQLSPSLSGMNFLHRRFHLYHQCKFMLDVCEDSQNLKMKLPDLCTFFPLAHCRLLLNCLLKPIQ